MAQHIKPHRPEPVSALNFVLCDYFIPNQFLII